MVHSLQTRCFVLSVSPILLLPTLTILFQLFSRTISNPPKTITNRTPIKTHLSTFLFLLSKTSRISQPTLDLCMTFPSTCLLMLGRHGTLHTRMWISILTCNVGWFIRLFYCSGIFLTFVG